MQTIKFLIDNLQIKHIYTFERDVIEIDTHSHGVKIT
jgi:hypothetical protein